MGVFLFAEGIRFAFVFAWVCVTTVTAASFAEKSGSGCWVRFSSEFVLSDQVLPHNNCAATGVSKNVSVFT